MTAPILWWKGENNPDESKAGLYATWEGSLTPTYAAGAVGQAFRLNFSKLAQNDYGALVVANNALFNFAPTASFSVRFWIKVETTDVVNAFFPVAKGGVTSSIAADWGIRLAGEIDSPYETAIALNVGGVNVNCTRTIGDSDLHEILWTYNNGYSFVYLDGVEILNDPTTQRFIANNLVTLRFGAAWYSQFAGLIDEIRIYDSVISVDNVDNDDGPTTTSTDRRIILKNTNKVVPVIKNQRLTPYKSGTNDKLQFKAEVYTNINAQPLYLSNIPVSLYLNYSGSWKVADTGYTNKFGYANLYHTCSRITAINSCQAKLLATVDNSGYWSNISRIDIVGSG
jgi:hypothetical protein